MIKIEGFYHRYKDILRCKKYEEKLLNYRAQEDVSLLCEGTQGLLQHQSESSLLLTKARLHHTLHRTKHSHTPLSMALSTFLFQGFDSNRLRFQTSLEAIINKPFVDFPKSSFTEISLSDMVELLKSDKDTLLRT
ncbi:hypothetical protein HID58_005862, partial [Brassica napus]